METAKRNGRRVVLYCRYSTPNQSDRSLEDQEREARALLVRLGIDGTYAHVINDAAESASKWFRDGFQDLLDLVKKGMISIVAVDDQARLTRGDSAVGTIRDLIFQGVRVVTGDGVDTHAEGWELKCHVLGVHNAICTDETARRIRRGQRGRVLAGLSTGDYPYGYRSEFADPERGRLYQGHGPRPERRVVINEMEAAVVRKIFRLYAHEKWSINAIARYLTKKCTPTGNRGRRWGHWRIRIMLTNPKYAGLEWNWGKTRTIRNSIGQKKAIPADPKDLVTGPADHLRIVDESTWRLAQERLEEVRKVFGVKPGQKPRGAGAHYSAAYPNSLLDNICFCAECGSKMNASGTRELPYKICTNRGANCKSVPRLPVREASERLIQFLSKLLNAMPDWIHEAISAARKHLRQAIDNQPGSIRALRQQLEDCYSAQQNLLDVVEQGQYQGSIVSKRLAELDEAIERLQQKLREAESLESAETAFPHDAWFRDELQDLASLLQANEPKVALIIKELIPRIYVERIVPHGRKRGFHRISFKVDGWAALAKVMGDRLPSLVADSIAQKGVSSPTFRIDVGTQFDVVELGQRVAAMRLTGLTWSQIAIETDISRRRARHAMRQYDIYRDCEIAL